MRKKVDGMEEIRKKKQKSKEMTGNELAPPPLIHVHFPLIDLHRDLSHLLHQKSCSGSVDQNDNSCNEALQD